LLKVKPVLYDFREPPEIKHLKGDWLEKRSVPDSTASSIPNYKTIGLVSACLASIFIALTSSSLNVALPSINNDFHSDAIVLSWIVTVFVLAASVFSVPFGKIADIIGIKKIFLFGMSLFALTSIVALFSNSAPMLIICRAFQGLACAMVAVNSTAMITALYPPKERGRALGINIACVYTGSSVGPFLGGIFTEHLGWRSIFAINIPVSLLVILLLVWKVKGEWCACKGEKLDYRGSLVYAVGLVALMYGFSLIPEIQGWVFILAGVIGVVIFLWWENRINNPVLDIKIFKHNRAFLFSNMAALIAYSAVFAISFLLSLYLQYIKGFSPEQAGLVLVVQPVTQALLSPLAGRLSDKAEPRIIASIGMGIVLLGLVSFSLLSDTTPTAVVVIILIGIGMGFALFSSPNANAIMSSISPKFLGVGAAVMATMRSVGQMLSMGIAMIIMAVVIGRVTITPEYYQAFLTSAKIAFGIFSILGMFAIAASLFRGKVR
jgi:EmrB/QacA subfamily drug resistance transporter